VRASERMRWGRRLRGGHRVAFGVLILGAACAGGDQQAERGTGATGEAVNVGATPSAAAGAAPTDPKLIALGDSVFHGQVGGGTCMTCHGQDAKGTQLGPNLADAQWLHGDGSYQFIVNNVTSGVTTPKQFPGVMPPKGGAPLTDDQVRAVAAYVYSLGRRGS
jgi:mono/diheme cytochrome c family protein